jgi:hypothetical protein
MVEEGGCGGQPLQIPVRQADLMIEGEDGARGCGCETLRHN